MSVNRIICFTILLLIMSASVLIVLPTIDYHVDDPDLIAYFNHDEGFLMDVAWYYYSGEKRESFQYWNDYGLELIYLADFAKIFLSKFIKMTPGTFVLILRWLHLIFWIAALLAMWRLIGRHFGNGWKALFGVGLLATSPAFPYFCGNLKPEPMVLFFIITGLDYALRIIDNPIWKNVILAIIFASAASVVKYAGVFLLPAIVLAAYLSARCAGQKALIRKIPASWILPALCGAVFLGIIFSTVFFYTRNTTGMTWFEEFGFWGTIERNKSIGYLAIFGTLLIAVSIALAVLGRARSKHLKNAVDIVSEINSYSMVVLALFVLVTAILGLKWLFHPKYFVSVFAQFGAQAFGHVDKVLSGGGLVAAYLENLFQKIQNFNPVVFGLFMLYLFMEIRSWRKNSAGGLSSFFKRLVLTGFLLPFFPYMLSLGRAAMHHMLPFFTVSVILSFQGIEMLAASFDKRALKAASKIFLYTLVAYTIFYNAVFVIKAFIYKYHQDDDIVFDVAKWWRENCNPETRIIADHPIRAYMPAEYKNVRFMKSFGGVSERTAELRKLTASFKPQLMYYNAGVEKDGVLPPIDEILPGAKAELAASFTNDGKYYKRWPQARYLIYRVSYK